MVGVRQGLGGDAALRALTIDAAKMYHVDDRIGSLLPGKDADLLIFTGHPFDADGRLERVIISGREVPNEGE
ncbi:MAG: amidohydrolase family protein [Planctomycetes bacterium]|nr:amidohydrolase family protein [Planctomycetota bacterium]